MKDESDVKLNPDLERERHQKIEHLKYEAAQEYGLPARQEDLAAEAAGISAADAKFTEKSHKTKKKNPAY